MKKLLAVLLALGLLFSFAACGEGNEEPVGQENPHVSNTDLVPYEEEPIITEMEGELKDLEAVLDQHLSLPEEWAASRCTVIDETVAQIEFSIGEDTYVARSAKGQQENLSDMGKIFTTTETVDVNGISVTIRYIDPEKSTLPLSFGVADAYDAEKDLSFCIIQDEFTSVEDLTAAMEALMESHQANSGESEAGLVMEDEICYI